MQRFRTVAVCLILVLLTGCSASGGNATSSPGVNARSSSKPARSQMPAVSAASFDVFVATPALGGDFKDETPGNTALMVLKGISPQIPCLEQYSDKLSAATKATWLKDANQDAFLIAVLFPTNEQAAAVQSGADAIVKCVAQGRSGYNYSQVDTVKMDGAEVPVYVSTGGDVFRVTMFTARNVTSVAIVRGDSRLTINDLTTEVYNSIQIWVV